MTNRLGIQGPPERMLLHDSLIVKRPTEFVSVQHIFNPDDVQFIPAPVNPLKVWCPGCFKMHAPDAFHCDGTRPTGRQVYCKACKKVRRKAGKHLPMIAHGRLKPFTSSET